MKPTKPKATNAAKAAPGGKSRGGLIDGLRQARQRNEDRKLLAEIRDHVRGIEAALNRMEMRGQSPHQP